MYKYFVKKETTNNPEIGIYTSYGIKITFVDKQKTKNIQYIPDVFLDENLANKFADLCTINNLEPVHIYDVIEDALINLQH